ncbi:MAG: ATP-dependent zinc metalloprotease FtsH [Erysipelotrichaceae bacterium]|nr:ATP-dependent zinc metalloprotease FtsH [Erysipelotrichaceae bacterium]
MRKKSPWGFLFSSLIIIGIIGLFIWLLFFNGPNAETLSVEKYATILANDRVTEVSITPKEQTIVIIEGRYKEYSATPSAVQPEKSFTLTVNWTTYSDSLFIKEVLKDGTTDEYINISSYASLDALTQDKAAKITTNDVYVTNFWDTWGPTIILGVITVGIAIFLFSRLSSSVAGSNNKALEFNKSRARRENKSKVRFDDVAGADEEKVEMQELVQYLKDPKKFSKFGAKLPKGVLLVGAPGTGKTLLAKAVAGEAGVPFYSISGSDFVEMFVGVGAGRVRDMFKVAKENAPCLIFIDEIDAVGRQRGAGLGGGNDEREQTLNQLLVEMDGFSDNAGIIVIAATNRDDVLDPALLRAGRFDRKITVSLPDRLGREAILKVHARNKILDANVDFAAIAKRTVGFSGADLENVLNEAAILAVRKNEQSVSMADIDEAIDRRISGPAKSSRSLNEHERKAIAYHEAGHAVIGLFLPHSDKVQKITIIPRGNTGGHVLMTPEDDRFLLTKKELEARIVGYLGGRTSEEVFFDDISTGAQNDIEVATRIARMMVTELGMSALGPIQYEKDTGSVFLGRDYNSSQKNFSTEVAFEIDKAIRKIIDTAHETARKILEEHREDVILIANTLLENETITAEEIEALLRDRKLPSKKQVVDTDKVETIPDGEEPIAGTIVEPNDNNE